MKLSLGRDLLTLSAASPDQGTATEELDGDRVTYDSRPLEIGFQARYLNDITDQIDEQVEFLFSDGAAPTVVRDVGQPVRALRADADARLAFRAACRVRGRVQGTAPRLVRLALTDFRNYPTLVWRNHARIVVVTGPNGSGKTNLLEAVSLLVPGRGLRGARMSELPRHGAAHWAVAARFDDEGDGFEIGTGTVPDGAPGRRVFRLDGAPLRSRGAIAARVSAIWLTPQMDRLFVEGASGRRRFLDRLVLALEPGHAREIAAHDEAMVGRNRLLATGRADGAWLDGLEDCDGAPRGGGRGGASRAGRAAERRADAAASSRPASRRRGCAACPIADRLGQEPALAVEDWLRGALAAGRAADARAGSAALGAHRADMSLSDGETGRPAATASTGQQKALLIGVVLAHAALVGSLRGVAPLLLLDEPRCTWTRCGVTRCLERCSACRRRCS